MKTGLALVVAFVLFTIGCATISEEEKNTALERARAAYSKAQADPKIEANAQVAMYEAAQALQKAEQARDSEQMQHLAYIAERKAQLATAIAEQKIAENEIARLSSYCTDKPTTFSNCLTGCKACGYKNLTKSILISTS